SMYQLYSGRFNRRPDPIPAHFNILHKPTAPDWFPGRRAQMSKSYVQVFPSFRKLIRINSSRLDRLIVRRPFGFLRKVFPLRFLYYGEIGYIGQIAGDQKGYIIPLVAVLHGVRKLNGGLRLRHAIGSDEAEQEHAYCFNDGIE